MTSFEVSGRKVTFEIVRRLTDSIGQVIHPLAVVDLNLSINGGESITLEKYQLDHPNEPTVPFDHHALILDTVIRKLGKGEKVKISFNEETFELEVVSVVHSLPLWEIDTDTRLDHAERLRQIGNDYFKKGAAFDGHAIHCYKRALFWASIVDKSESRAIRQQSRAQILNNISAVHAAAKNNHKTIYAATKALDIGSEISGCLKNKNNVLLRRAFCYAQMNEFEAAQADLNLIEEPTEAQLKKMRQITSRIRAVTQATNRQMSKGLSKLFG